MASNGYYSFGEASLPGPPTLDFSGDDNLDFATFPVDSSQGTFALTDNYGENSSAPTSYSYSKSTFPPSSYSFGQNTLGQTAITNMFEGDYSTNFGFGAASSTAQDFGNFEQNAFDQGTAANYPETDYPFGTGFVNPQNLDHGDSVSHAASGNDHNTSTDYVFTQIDLHQHAINDTFPPPESTWALNDQSLIIESLQGPADVGQWKIPMGTDASLSVNNQCGIASNPSQVFQPHRSPTKINCDWPGCISNATFPDVHAKSQHVINFHVHEVLGQWPGASSWPGCTLKAVFKTQKSLVTHVENLHTNPLVCTVTSCQHKKPFAKQGDLERHEDSVHKPGRSFRCPRSGCPRHLKPFSRKDKFKENMHSFKHGPFCCTLEGCENGYNSNEDLEAHMRKAMHVHLRCEYCYRSGYISNEDLETHMRERRHGPLHCPHTHCIFGFVTNEDLLSHQAGSAHGIYECSIGSCVNSTSDFSHSALRNHLFKPHGINSDCSEKLISNMNENEKTVTQVHANTLEPKKLFWSSWTEEDRQCCPDREAANRTISSQETA